MSADNLRELFIEELKDIYDAEHRIAKALPKLAKASNTKRLTTAFESHLRQTEEHIARLETVFRMIGETPVRKTCKAMVGLLEEGQGLIDEEAPPSVKDHALVAAAQKVEHYEIATYGCMRAWAELLDEPEGVKTFQKTLDEEGDADRTLTRIAMTIEPEGAEEDEEEEAATSKAAPRIAGRKPAPAMTQRR